MKSENYIRRLIKKRIDKMWKMYHSGPSYIGVNGAYMTDGLWIFPCGKVADDRSIPVSYPDTMQEGKMNCKCLFCRIVNLILIDENDPDKVEDCPCPFCGGDAELISYKVYGKPTYRGKCLECRSEGPASQDHKKAELLWINRI